MSRDKHVIQIYLRRSCCQRWWKHLPDFCILCSSHHKESARSSSSKWTKTKIICIVLQTFLRLFQISSQKKLFLTAPMSKTKFEVPMKHLKVLLKGNWWWNFTCVCAISLNFEIYFLEFPWEFVFGVFSGNCLYLRLFENAKRTEIYWTLFCYKVFVHLKLKLLDFLSDFLLNIFVLLYKNQRYIWRATKSKLAPGR